MMNSVCVSTLLLFNICLLFGVGTCNGVQTLPPVVEYCEALNTSIIPYCNAFTLAYSSISYPTMNGVENQQVAFGQLSNFRQFILSNCSGASLVFLCSYYAPFCFDNGQGTIYRLSPCRSLCQTVYDECQQYIDANSHQYTYPPHLNCSLFPEDGSLCFRPPNLQNLVLPSLIPGINAPIPTVLPSSTAVTTSTELTTTTVFSSSTSTVIIIGTSTTTIIMPSSSTSGGMSSSSTSGGMSSSSTSEMMMSSSTEELKPSETKASTRSTTKSSETIKPEATSSSEIKETNEATSKIEVASPTSRPTVITFPRNSGSSIKAYMLGVAVAAILSMLLYVY